MKNKILEIIEKAIGLDSRIIEDYLFDEQKKSDLSTKVFFGMLKDEIEKIKKNDTNIITELNQKGLIILYKYHLLDVIVDGLFESSLNERELTPDLAKILGYKLPFESKKPSFKKEEDKELCDIENKFNQMPIDQVRYHFKPLIEKENPKGVIWMSASDFDIFIERSFGMQTDLSKPKINLGHGAKYAIVKLFYGFYDKCQVEFLTQNRNKGPFIELLKKAFDTDIFDDMTNDNFKEKSNYEWNY
jgi:hypothetical protein